MNLPREFFSQISDDVVLENRLPTHDQTGKVTRTPGLLGAMHQQCPALVVRVQHVSIVDALVCIARCASQLFHYTRRRLEKEKGLHYSQGTSA